MKVKVVVKQTHTATIEVGDLPPTLIKDVLVSNDGTFDGNWSLSDVPSANETWSTDSVEVIEVSR